MKKKTTEPESNDPTDRMFVCTSRCVSFILGCDQRCGFIECGYFFLFMFMVKFRFFWLCYVAVGISAIFWHAMCDCAQ